jgi:hypothetical protein
MTSSVHSGHAHRGGTASLARLRDGNGRSRHARYARARVTGRHGPRRVVAVAAVLVLAVLAAGLLDLAGFDRRVAGDAIAVLTCDVFASWFVIARANRAPSRRLHRARHDQTAPVAEGPLPHSVTEALRAAPLRWPRSAVARSGPTVPSR